MTFEAVLLIAFVLVITGVVKNAVPNLPSTITPIVSIVIGIVAALVIAETDFADNQLVNGIPLGNLNFWSKVVIGVMLGGGASGLAVTGKIISNIGSNHVTTDRTIVSDVPDRAATHYNQ
jgi:Na+/H+ antiporter NhaC